MKIVHKIEPGMDRQDILATTYQMRNFYKQLSDDYFDALDIMNYIQHHMVVNMCKDNVLDVCCGRGLLLPMLRYYNKKVTSYTGVDIETKNASFMSKRVTNDKPIENDYYSFKINFVKCNVANMSDLLTTKYETIVYTSSIEHMHKDMGIKSLKECRKLISSNGILVLTCPNTPEDQNGYDTQYAAHVYEWKQSELFEELDKAGFDVVDRWGLLVSKKVLNEKLGEQIKILSKFIPNEWLVPVLSPLFPDEAKETGFICKPKKETLF